MTARCKSCDQDVKWVRMETGGRMLVNLPPEKRVVIHKQMVDNIGQDARLEERGAVLDTYTSHFATCPKADEHRRGRER